MRGMALSNRRYRADRSAGMDVGRADHLGNGETDSLHRQPPEHFFLNRMNPAEKYPDPADMLQCRRKILKPARDSRMGRDVSR
jgi:hypothetical protein